MTQDFPSMQVDVGGAGDYVVKIDAMIQCIKEMYHIIRSGLAWEIPKFGSAGYNGLCSIKVKCQAYDCRSRQCTSKSIIYKYKKELKVAFSNYVEA
jgi:hypothetical protein